MAAHVPEYYAGLLNVGNDPDWEHVAKVVDLLRASGVRMETSPAVLDKDGLAGLPFFTKASDLREGLCGAQLDPKKAIEALCPYELTSYVRLDPKKAGGVALRAMTRLANVRENEEAAKASDLKPRPAPATCTEDAFAGLVGLAEQRDTLRKIATLVGKHGRGAVDCLHMAFIGEPGTGKTELARRLLAHLDGIGVTDGNGTFVKAGAADLVAHYVGQTPSKTRAVVERALGGMLFIDEAYTLLSADDYGQEAIDTLVELLEEHRARLVCVIAGYPDELEELFRRNPGLRDRFGFRIRFAGYSTDELVKITQLFAERHGFSIGQSALPELHACLDALRSKRGFANARTARRLCDRAILETASRCDATVVSAHDVRAAFEQPDLGGDAAGCRVGFGR